MYAKVSFASLSADGVSWRNCYIRFAGPREKKPQSTAKCIYADSKNEIKINGKRRRKRGKKYLFIWVCGECGTLLYVLSLGK